MNPKTTISISEARKRIFEIAEEVQKPDTYYVLTENGKPKVVVLSADEFESLMETLEVWETFPNLKKDIAEVERDIATGAYTRYTTLEEILAKEGYVVADKKKKYGISTQNKTKRTKRTRKAPKT